MNIYYTAKEIEELAANGVKTLEIGPGVALTDFARETAQYFDITVVQGGKKPAAAAQPAAPGRPSAPSGRYSKPPGCSRASASPAGRSPAALTPDTPAAGSDSNTVNKLIDLMGKVIKRGG